MKIEIENLCFGFEKKEIFKNFSLDIHGADKRPLVFLGPSGCGKTTLLKIIAGLFLPEQGRIYRGDECNSNAKLPVSFVFQEPRLLPWFTVLENISLPLTKISGKLESRNRALHFLNLLNLEDKAFSYPETLSGGQRQRVSIARSFAYSSEIILMDEPFQSLDIPLRIELMELCLSLLEKEKRMALVVTHDPREAVFMGSRIIILSQPPVRIVFDEQIELSTAERGYGSPLAGELEKRIIEKLKN